MAFDLAIYPLDWKALSARIRHTRAAGRCECTGECGHDHAGRCTARNGDECRTNPLVKVMLTVAHLDARGGPCQCKEETGLKCGIEEHLKAMCQSCHLIYDMPHHVFNARRTRAARAGQLWFEGLE